jgi:hypothetical protein
MRVEFVLAAGSTEPAVAFPTFAAVLAFGTASIALLWPLMKGVEDRTKALKDAMPDKLADPGFVRHRDGLRKELMGWALIANVFDLCVLLALAAILYLGPKAALSLFATGSLTRDFTILERIIYSIAGIAWILAYSFQGARPWLKGLRQYLKAGSWLTERKKER